MRMKQYVSKPFGAMEIGEITNDGLLVEKGTDAAIQVDNTWIGQNEPKVGQMLIRDIRGRCSVMSKAEFNQNYDAYEPPAPPEPAKPAKSSKKKVKTPECV